ALGQAKLEREVSDLRLLLRAELLRVPGVPGALLHVIVEVVQHSLVVRHKALVTGEGIEAGLAQQAEHPHRVAPALLPQAAAQPLKQGDCLVVPAPADVVGKLRQAAQLLWKLRDDVKGLNGSHGWSPNWSNTCVSCR